MTVNAAVPSIKSCLGNYSQRHPRGARRTEGRHFLPRPAFQRAAVAFLEDVFYLVGTPAGVT